MAAVEEATKLTYSEVLSIINEHLGQDAFYKATTTAGEPFLSMCNQVGIDVTVSPSGNVLGYSKHVVGSKPLSSAEEISQALNSNLQSGTAAVANTGAFNEIVNTPVKAGKVTPVSTVTKFTNGVKGVLNTPVAGKITPYIMAASAGIQLGKTIDSTIYNIGKAMGANPPEELNPETWNNITADMSDKGLEGVDKWAFNTILGLNPDTGEATMYADENAFAYMAQWLKNQKFFDKTNIIDNNQKVGSFTFNGTMIKYETEYSHKYYKQNTNYKFTDFYAYVNEEKKYFYTAGALNPTVTKPIYYINVDGVNIVSMPDNVSAVELNGIVSQDGTWGGTYIQLKDTYTFNNKTVKFIKVSGPALYEESKINNFNINNNENIKDLAWLLVYGNYSTSYINGITDQTSANIPDLSTVSTLEEILDLLKKTYPELWDNAVQQDVMQPDGTTKTYTYVPLPMPTEGEGSQVGTTGAVQNKPTVTPDDSTESQLSTLIKILTNSQNQPQGQTKELPKDYPINPTKTPNPPDTGGGDTPTVVPVTGSASSLYAIYNPTLAEINSFGAWLWSDNFIEQIKKLFSDPMQAIIGLHKVYATPITGGAQNIKVGYLDSGVSSKIVTNQYTTIDCGTISCAEYFGNVFDYSPYTEISLYLPFIGIVNLDVADVMRASIHIIYHVDVLTGACLAEVKVTRDSAGGTLYQYAGNAAVTLPISSGSYMGIVASLASIAGGVAGTIASGGAAAPMLIGAAGSALNARTRVEHSGGFSGNAGAMGGKIPYLIISRPQTELAENYGVYIGNPSNHTVTLGSCSGYVQVKECHLENIPATQNELNQIESLLKGGILL